MAQPNTSPITSPPSTSANNYDACADGAIGPFKKMTSAAPLQGHGWTYIDSIADADGGGWRQV